MVDILYKKSAVITPPPAIEINHGHANTLFNIEVESKLAKEKQACDDIYNPNAADPFLLARRDHIFREMREQNVGMVERENPRAGLFGPVHKTDASDKDIVKSIIGSKIDVKKNIGPLV